MELDVGRASGSECVEKTRYGTTIYLENERALGPGRRARLSELFPSLLDSSQNLKLLQPEIRSRPSLRCCPDFGGAYVEYDPEENESTYAEAVCV